MTTFISPKMTTSLPYSTNTNRWYLICKSEKSGTIDGFFPEYLICKSEKSVLLWALTKVSSRNQVICLSFAFPGFVGTEQHSYDFEIQVVLAQRFSFHYRPASGSDLFLPLLVAPRRCLLRTVVQMLHPCILFLHKCRDSAVLLQFDFFDAVF